MSDISVRELRSSEMADALSLVWEVFNRFEAPEYSQDGVDEFYRSIHDAAFLSTLRSFGAFCGGELAGVISTRSESSHIALFFVREDFQRQGIGTALFQRVLPECRAERMTVNSSPFAVPVYRALGFHDTEAEKTVNGLRFTPMELVCSAARGASPGR